MMKISVVDCLDWKVSSKPKHMAGFAHSLMDERFDLEALWSYPGSANENRIAVISKRPDKVERLLHSMGVRPRRSKCLYLAGEETASAVPGMLEKLSSAGIPVKYSDILATGREVAAAIWVRGKDLPAAIKALESRASRRH